MPKRKNKGHGEAQEITAVQNQPFVFSSSLNDSSVNPTSPVSTYANGDRSDFTSLNGSANAPNSTATAIPPYQEVSNSRPQQTKRRTTGNTIRSTASSIWVKIREPVSHFRVPRLAAPWDHEVPKREQSELGTSETIRNFDYRRQRRRLFINGFFQWCITAGLCLALAGCLDGFYGLYFLTLAQKHAFNAVVTGLSIAIGLNIASSFTGFAQMMRWRLLAAKYRPLQDFELIMNCDSQIQVFRLLWAGRTRGRWIPNKTQLLCFVWLTLNIALQVFTALLGLTYSVDTSSTREATTHGNVSVADLSYIHQPNVNFTDYLDQGAAANSYGIEGQAYFVYYDVPDDDQTWEQGIYTTSAENSYWYRFIDQSASTDSTENVVSTRTISSTATCESLDVLPGGFASQDAEFEYLDPHTGKNVSISIASTSPGSGTWISNSNATCGPRCTQVMMLLSADDGTNVPIPRFFNCNNTVGQVTNADYFDTPDSYEMANQQARLWAGSIGWSGFASPNTSLQYVRYSYASDWSPNGNVTAPEIAQDLMQFTTASIAAMDTMGPRITVPGDAPLAAQVVTVEWPFAIAILAGIPFIQFLVLVCVLIWANKAIIKDTSHLSTARLLRPVVERLGNRGCLLTGDEIAEVLGNYRLRYGVRSPDDRGTSYVGTDDQVQLIRHVDVIEEDERLGTEDVRMLNGLYDGTSTWCNEKEELRKRRTRRNSL